MQQPMDHMESLGSGPEMMRGQALSFAPDAAAMERLESGGGPLLEQTSSFFTIGQDPFASVPGTSSLMAQHEPHERADPFHHNHTSSSVVQRLLDDLHLASSYAESAQRVVAADAQGSSALLTLPGEQQLFQAPTLTDGLASGVHEGIAQQLEDAYAAAAAAAGASSSPGAQLPASNAASNAASNTASPRRRTLGDGPLPAGHMGSASAGAEGSSSSCSSSAQPHVSYSAPWELLAPVPEHGDEHNAQHKLSRFSTDGTPHPHSFQQHAQAPHSPHGTASSNAHSTGSHDPRPARPTISVEPAPSAPAILSPTDARMHVPRSRRPSDGSRPPRQRRRSTGELLLPSYQRASADGLMSPTPRRSSRRATVDDASVRSTTELGLTAGSSSGGIHASLSSPRHSPHGRSVLVPGGLSLEAVEAALGPGSSNSELGAARQLSAEGHRGGWGDAGRSVDQHGMLAAAMAAVRGDGPAGGIADVQPRPRRSTRDLKTAFELMQAQIAKLEQTNMDLQERIILVQTALAESQAALAEAQSDAIAAGSSKQQLEEQIRHLTAKVKGGEHQVEFLSKQLDAQQQQLRLSADALGAKGRAAGVLEADVDNLKERIAELNREVEAGKRKVAHEAEETRHAEAEAAALRRDNQALQDSLNKARVEGLELREKLADSQAEMGRKVVELSGQAGSLDEQLQDMRHVATGLGVKSTQLEASNAQLSAQLAAAEGAKAALRQQLESARAALSAANAAAAAANAAAYAPVQYASPSPPPGNHGPSRAAWQSYSDPPQQQYVQPPSRSGEFSSHANGHTSSSMYSMYRPSGYDTGYSRYAAPREEQRRWQQQQQQSAWASSPPSSPAPTHMRAEASYQQQQQQQQIPQQLYGSPDPLPDNYGQQQQHSPPYYTAQQPTSSARPVTAGPGPLARSYDAPAWFGMASSSKPPDMRASLQLPPQQSTGALAGQSAIALAAWQQQQQQQQQQRRQSSHDSPTQWSAALPESRERPSSAGPYMPPYATAGAPSAAQPSWQEHAADTGRPSYNQGYPGMSPATAPGSGTSAERTAYSAAPSPVRTAAPNGPSPYGTELTAVQLMATTKQLEDGLLMLSKERDELESEFAKMPLHGGRTLKERQRKVEVEARLEELRKEISTTRLQLKRLGH